MWSSHYQADQFRTTSRRKSWSSNTKKRRTQASIFNFSRLIDLTYKDLIADKKKPQDIASSLLDFIYDDLCNHTILTKIIEKLAHISFDLKETKGIQDFHAKNQIERSPLFHALENHEDSFTADEVLDILWAVNKLEYSYLDLCRNNFPKSFISRLINNLNYFSCEKVITTWWVLAKFKLEFEKNKLSSSVKNNPFPIRYHKSELINKLIHLCGVNSDHKELKKQALTLLWSLGELDIEWHILKQIKINSSEIPENNLGDLLFNTVKKNTPFYKFNQIVKIFNILSNYRITINQEEGWIRRLFEKINNERSNINQLHSSPLAHFIHDMATLGLTWTTLRKWNITIFDSIQNTIKKDILYYNNFRLATIFRSWALLSLNDPEGEIAFAKWLHRRLMLTLNDVSIKNGYKLRGVLNQVYLACDFFDLPFPSQLNPILEQRPKNESSPFHTSVASILIPLLKAAGATEIEEEKKEGAYALDLFAILNGHKLNFEFDGSMHYDQDGNPTSIDELRDFLLEKKNFNVIRIQYSVFNNLSDQSRFLERLIQPYSNLKKKHQQTSILWSYLQSALTIWSTLPSKTTVRETILNSPKSIM